MSTRAEQQPKPASGLSVTTLAIASVASIAAAVFIHQIWTGGAIIGAGITPIIVAVVSEALKRPVSAVSSMRAGQTAADEPQPVTDDTATRVQPDPAAPPADPNAGPVREDRFGIWEADQQQSRSFFQRLRLRGTALKVALATGALAFVIGAFALTGADLVFGGSAGGGDRFIVVPGKQSKSDRDDKPTQTTETQTTETVTQTETVPAEPEEEETPPTVPTTPQQTVPTTPTVPPAQTTPTVPTTPAVPPTTTPAPDEAPAG